MNRLRLAPVYRRANKEGSKVKDEAKKRTKQRAKGTGFLSGDIHTYYV